MLPIQGTKTLEPNIHGDSERKFPERRAVNKGRFTKEELAFSTVTPLQQQRRDHIDEMEYGLLQHPLALYPHLEESMPPDVSGGFGLLLLLLFFCVCFFFFFWGGGGGSHGTNHPNLFNSLFVDFMWVSYQLTNGHKTILKYG